MPEWQVNAPLELQEYYVSGKASNVTGVLQRIIGRAPIRLDQFLAEIRDDFRPQSANA